MAKEIEWNKHFNIGIDSIDNAHRKLFSIVRKLVYLYETENNGQWACAEGIKFFKNYAIKHFAEEEAYMRSINYSNYEIHKCLHDDIRYKTLPALEKDLLETNYSQESIQHFLGICLGWLTAHILTEDRAITGKVLNKWKKDNTGKKKEALEKALADTIQELFGLQTDVVSEHYNGENFGNSIVDRLSYRSKDGSQTQIFLVFEASLVLQAVNSMLNTQLQKIDKMALSAIKELSPKIAGIIGAHLESSSQFQLKSNHLMTIEQLRQELNAKCFDYSLLLNTGHGYLALCIESWPGKPDI